MERTPTKHTVAAVEEALALLQHERSSLHGVTRDIEPEFVRLGATLEEMVVAIEKIAGAAGRLRATLGAEGRTGPRTLVEKVAAAVMANLAQAEALREQLRGIHRGLGTISAQEEEFEKAVTVFWMLKTGFRVEAASLRPEYRGVLFGLTEGMDAVHLGLRRVVEAQFGRIARAEGEIGMASSDLQDIQVLARETLADARAQVDREAMVLAAALSPAAGWSEAVSKRAGDASKRAKSVIISLQYPDIVRQKVEHIVEAIDRLQADVMGALSEEGDPTAVVRAAATAHVVARVQLEQLRDARAEIEAAGRNTVSGIEDMLAFGEALLAAAQRLYELASLGLREVRESTSTIGRLEAIHRSVTSEVAAIVGRIRAAIVAEIRALVRELSVDVQGKTEDVRFMALNASAQAIRVPGARALGELATLAQRHAAEVFDLTQVMLARATDAISDVEGLEAALDRCGAASTGGETEFDAEVTAAHAEIDERCAAALSLFDGIEPDFNRARAVAQETLRRLRFTETVRERFTRAEGAFERLQSATRPLFERARGEPTVLSALDELQGKYTMQRERDVHAAATAAARASAVFSVVLPAARPIGAPSETEAGEFGENVDLF